MSVIWFLVKTLGKPQAHNIDLKYLVLRNCMIHYKLLREHEDVINNKVKLLSETIELDGYLKYPILIDARTFTMLNGRHRFHALRTLGYNYIPYSS